MCVVVPVYVWCGASKDSSLCVAYSVCVWLYVYVCGVVHVYVGQVLVRPAS